MATTRGQRFRTQVKREHDGLNLSETVLLDEIVGVMDTIDGLPAGQVTEKRQQRILLSRLLGQLALPADDGEPEVLSQASLRGKRAAEAKWRKEKNNR